MLGKFLEFIKFQKWVHLLFFHKNPGSQAENRFHEGRIVDPYQGGMMVHAPNLGPAPRQLGLIFAHSSIP
jgi:hypothetical protein